MDIDRNPIEGTASVSASPPAVAPQKVTWEVNAEEKVATASLLGGVLTIRRRPDTGKFEGRFVVEHPVEEAQVEGAEPVPADSGDIDVTIALHHCDNLVVAQKAAEALARESLSKTHPEVHALLTAEEGAAEVAAAGPDPF